MDIYEKGVHEEIADLPDELHVLAEQKIVKAVADSFRPNPEFDTEEAIMALGTGEALVTFLNEKGEPGIVEKVTILPPQSQMGTIEDDIRTMQINNSRFKGKYDELIDRESAFEKIQSENERLEQERQEEEKNQASNQNNNNYNNGNSRNSRSSNSKPKKKTKSTAEKAFTKATNSALTSFGRKLGNEFFKKLFK